MTNELANRVEAAGGADIDAFCNEVRRMQSDGERPSADMIAKFQDYLERGLLTLDGEGWCWSASQFAALRARAQETTND